MSLESAEETYGDGERAHRTAWSSVKQIAEKQGDLATASQLLREGIPLAEDSSDGGDVTISSTYVRACVAAGFQPRVAYLKSVTVEGFRGIGKAATLDLPTVLAQIASRAQTVLKARDVVLRLLEPEGTLPVVVRLTTGPVQVLVDGRTFSLDPDQPS